MSTDAVLWGGVVVMTLFILLFMGPAMWSSTSESVFGAAWRKLRESLKEPPRNDKPPDPDQPL